jgi:hypothetical protein
MSNKLTRQQACAELARRVGAITRFNESGMPEFFYVAKSGWNGYVEWNPFTDHAAAHELVVWLQNARFKGEPVEPRPARRWHAFLWQLYAVLGITGPNMLPYEDLIARLMAATPEQIACAACDTLGIEVNDQEK